MSTFIKYLTVENHSDRQKEAPISGNQITHIFFCLRKSTTSKFLSPEQTRSRSSPVPVPDTGDIGRGENLIDQQKEHPLFIKMRHE